jgi:hypothetical protein
VAAHGSGQAAGGACLLVSHPSQQLKLCTHCAGDDLNRLVEAAELSQSLQGREWDLVLRSILQAGCCAAHGSSLHEYATYCACMLSHLRRIFTDDSNWHG